MEPLSTLILSAMPFISVCYAITLTKNRIWIIQDVTASAVAVGNG